VILLSPQVLILATAVSLSAIGGWKVTAMYYQAEIAGMRLDKAKAAAEAEKLNHSLSVAGLELSGAISERNANRREKIRVIEIEVLRDVIKYRNRPSVLPVDGTCYLDSEWVRLHDLAASSGVPDTASGAAESDSAATYADTIETVTDNYATCNQLRATVIGWQEFYEGVRRLHEH